MLFPLFPHHCCIPLIIATSKNVLITVCVKRHCQPREANIPDRVHYACDVNEIGARHVSYRCIGRLSTESWQTGQMGVSTFIPFH